MVMALTLPLLSVAFKSTSEMPTRTTLRSRSFSSPSSPSRAARSRTCPPGLAAAGAVAFAVGDRVPQMYLPVGYTRRLAAGETVTATGTPAASRHSSSSSKRRCLLLPLFTRRFVVHWDSAPNPSTPWHKRVSERRLPKETRAFGRAPSPAVLQAPSGTPPASPSPSAAGRLKRTRRTWKRRRGIKKPR